MQFSAHNLYYLSLYNMGVAKSLQDFNVVLSFAADISQYIFWVRGSTYFTTCISVCTDDNAKPKSNY